MGRTTGKNKIAKKIAGQAVRHATGKVQGKAMRTAAKHLRGYVLATLILLGAAIRAPISAVINCFCGEHLDIVGYRRGLVSCSS